MLVAELRKDAFKPFGHGISWTSMHFQTFFPGVESSARNTALFISNWPTQYKMIFSKCLPKMKNVKSTGFSAFHLENEKKHVDSCRAASQPIPLFLVNS